MTTTYVVKKTLINDFTFRMPQYTSSEVTVGYIYTKEKDWNLIKTTVKKTDNIQTYQSLLENI